VTTQLQLTTTIIIIVIIIIIIIIIILIYLDFVSCCMFAYLHGQTCLYFSDDSCAKFSSFQNLHMLLCSSHVFAQCSVSTTKKSIA